MRRRAAILVVLCGWAWGAPAAAQGTDLGLGSALNLSRPTQAPPTPEPLTSPDPVVGIELNAEMEERVVRPFYTRRASRDGTYLRTQVLWPLWLYERHNEKRRIQLLPLFYYYRDVHRYGDVVDDERDWSLFPLVWGGSSTRDGGYFAVFPLGGMVRDLVARDEVRFALFPLWLQIRDKGHVSTSWLWPIYTRGRGGGKRTFRLWPFYGRTTKENKYDRRFYAWPFVYREEFDLDRPQPGRRSMTWPFWTTETSARRRYRSVLWPFFSRTDHYKNEYTEVAAPWPFFVRRTGKSDKLQLWPFFTGFKNAGRESHHVLGPLIRYSKDTSEPGVVRSQTSVALVLREERIVWEDTGALYQYARVWPVFDHERWPDGGSRTNFPSPLWFRDKRGFGYQYAPVYTLYHHERHPDGEKLSWALWNLYRHERTAEHNIWRVGPALRYAADYVADTRRFDVLGGAIGVHRDGDSRSLRLGWGLKVPLGRSRGTQSAPEPAHVAHREPGLPLWVGT